MPQSLALADLVVPYIVRAQDLGSNHAILSAIFVENFETAADSLGTVIRGRAGFQGRLRIDLANGGFGFANDETDPPFDPDRRTPVFDIRETHIDFELFVPRASSAIIANGVATISAAGFAPARAVLDSLDQPPVDPGLSDFPGSGFTLDLIVVAPTMRPAFLHPAQSTPEGGLISDITRREVSITLPRLRFRLSHGNDTTARLRFELISAGVAGLDDPGDVAAAELVSMDPPYAFIGRQGERNVGIGFRKAVLDLSDGYTPPDITEKFGFGDDWTGLFLPEVRFYIAPEGVRDLAFAAGVRDLLVGVGEHAGVSGDFDVALINQGSGSIRVSARFFDAQNKSYGIERRGEDIADATLPPSTRMVVDVEGGRAPYIALVSVAGGAPQTGQAFAINLAGPAPVNIVLDVSDSTAATPITARLTITARRRSPQAQLPIPRGDTAPAQAVVLSVAEGSDPRIVLVRQTDVDAILTVDPPEATVRWSVDGGAETPPQTIFGVPVAGGQTRQLRARVPATLTENQVDFFFYFDEPYQSEVRSSDEGNDLGEYAGRSDNVWTSRARSRLRGDKREPGGEPPLKKHDALFRTVFPPPPTSPITVRGEASFENDPGKDKYNYRLARRRAIAVKRLLIKKYALRDDDLIADPAPSNPADYPNLTAWIANWQTHGAPNDRDWWKASVLLPSSQSRAERQSQGTLNRPTAPPPPAIIERDPPPPSPPRPPDWFRSARLKVRIVRNRLVAVELLGEVDFQTLTEQRLAATGQLGGNPPPDTRTLRNGTPLGTDNPSDGITQFHMLMQSDDATGRASALLSIGADPADKDGLFAWGPLPGETPDPSKHIGRTLLGSYISFWPLLVDLPGANSGRVEDALLTGAALALPGVIALLPWFRVERIILYGAEYLQRVRDDQAESYLMFDVQADWSAAIPSESNPIIQIERTRPLSVRYKAIGLRLSNRKDDGTTAPQFSLRPVFDASRGFTIDLAQGGGLRIAEPLGRILRVAGARLSRTNPLTLEVDIALGADLGVVAIDRASFRAYLEEPPRFELTALAARVDIPGTLIGSGFLEIKPAEIAGQLDLTIRPIGLRVSGSVGIAQVEGDGRKATGVFVGLELILPVGIPLGASGLGIFGFRGLFGMHYERNPALGAGSAVPALEWLRASKGRPHLLATEDGTRLWTPKLDQWAFGLGVQLGTMEGGFLLNLDGTLILELPGPRLLIVMNARFLQSLPSIDEMGQGGILAVIEITPAHVLIAILANYDIPKLLKVVIPVEAFFDFHHIEKWHLYIGRRPDDEIKGPPIEVDVLGIVKGTGYLVIKGDGLVPYKGLAAVTGFGIGIGAGASFTLGLTDIGLYLRIGGGFDAVVGFDPFLLNGIFELAGELRLFIISIGVGAKLDLLARDTSDSVQARIEGEVCGEVDFFFFSVEGCVSITIGGGDDTPPIPALVEKMTLRSRSPALALGTATDQPVDGSLGEARMGDTLPGNLPVVPIDSIPVLAMVLPAASDGASFQGKPLDPAPLPLGGFVARGSEEYAYRITAVTLERVGVAGSPVIGTETPATWWTLAGATKASPAAALALLTWEPEAATKALEKNDVRKESINQRWGTVCDDSAPPASVLWTFRFERLGPSQAGWRLEGVAWPDPPGTRRSVPPGTALRVSERWRSGDAQLDMARGIIPAMVVANPISCREAQARPEELTQLVRVGGTGPVIKGASGGSAGLVLAPSDPVLRRLIRADGKNPFRVSMRLAEKAADDDLVAAISVGSLIVKLRSGQPIGRAETEALLSGSLLAAADPAPGRSPCRGKALASPRFDNGDPVILGDPARWDEITRSLDKLGITHGPLDEVVVLHTGPAAELRVLLFVNRFDIERRRVIVRLLAGDGTELASVVATASDIVPPRALPPQWIDTAGPWLEDVSDTFDFLRAASPLTVARTYVPVLLELKGNGSVDRAEVGVLPEMLLNGQDIRDARPTFYLAVVEATLLAEIERHDWDDTEIRRERKVLSSFFGPDSTKNALLHPDSTYKVTVAWSGERKSDHRIGTGSQSFWFRTDGTPPAKLDPWLLVTWPGDYETQVFGGEPIRVVFNTHDVDLLFGAYGRELRLRLNAAHAIPPTPPPGLTHPVLISATAGTLIAAGASVLSPFESILEEAVKGTCIPVDETRSRQSMVVVPIPLDPYTDYILDIISVPVGAPETEAGDRLLRRHFSTGGYRKTGDFAAGLMGVLVKHQAITPGTLALALAPFSGRDPQGAEMDEMLRAIGLEALPAPSAPGVTVLWEQTGANVPQPVAILVDADEPLWRSRLHPKEVADPDGLPGTRRWQMVVTEWLRLEVSPSGSDAVLTPGKPIRAPGGQRALAVLAGTQRGRRLRLDLVRSAFPDPFLNLPEERNTVLDVLLNRAPWEE